MPLYRQPVQQTIIDALGVRVTDAENLISTLSDENAILFGTLFNRITALESSLSHPGYVSGRYYQGLENIYSDTTTNGALNTSTITYIPFPVHSPVQISRLALYCSTASTDANARIGIYSNLNGLPEDLILDTGSMAVATAGAKEAIISTNLNKAWYWFAGITSKAPYLYSAIAFLGNNHIIGQLAPTSISATCMLRNTGTYASLPSKAPKDNLSLITGNFAPMFWFKVN